MSVEKMIEGLHLTPLKIFEDDRGSVFHMLRSDSPTFQGFGEVYFSSVRHKAIKAWKRNLIATANLTVPVGGIDLVIFDDRASSPTRGNVAQLTTGGTNFVLITVPPNVWYGFRGREYPESLIANCLDRPYDSSTVDECTYPNESIPHIWPELE